MKKNKYNIGNQQITILVTNKITTGDLKNEERSKAK